MEKNRKDLKNVASRVLKESNIPEDQKFGSVIAILMVISIILTLVRVLQECNKTKTLNMTSEDKSAVYGDEIRAFSKKRGWFTRMRIKRIIKKELPTEDYHKYGIKLTEALLDTGETLNNEEVHSLMEAANV